jgi:hypothetical protein
MPDRRRLPDRRCAETFDMQFGKLNTVFNVTVGYYDWTRREVGEVFIAGTKAGSEMDAIARDGAVLLSLALQHGVTLDTIRHAITRNAQGAPDTIVGAVIDRISSYEKSQAKS